MNGKNVALGLLLSALAIVGPAVAYGSVSVIYPKSTHTVNVETSPPITFSEGADYAQANNVGFASGQQFIDYNGAFNITISGLSGGNITIDNYTMVALDKTRVDSYKLQIATALTGTLDANMIQDLKIQIWTGSNAPNAANGWWSGVCARLDLESALNTESTGGPCDATYANMQIIFQLRTFSSGSSTVSVRPSSLVLV
jgi:hypothetical protein